MADQATIMSERIEKDVRFLIGDLQMQILIMKNLLDLSGIQMQQPGQPQQPQEQPRPNPLPPQPQPQQPPNPMPPLPDEPKSSARSNGRGV